MKFILNVGGGLFAFLGGAGLLLTYVAPCDAGMGKCGDAYVPLISLVLLAVGIAALIHGSKTN